VFGDKQVTKGIKKTAKRNLDGSFTQTQFTSIRWAFLDRNLDDVTTFDVTVHESLGLVHGTVDRHGVCHPPVWQLTADQVEATFALESDHSWTWWFDPVWFATLAKRPWLPTLPEWLEQLWSKREVSAQLALDAL